MSGTYWPTLTGNSFNYSNDLNKRFEWLEENIVPMTEGQKTNAAYNLGELGNRWRNILFSGQMLLSGGSSSVIQSACQSDTTTGIRFSNTNTVDFVLNGINQHRLNISTGYTNIAASTTFSFGNYSDTMKLAWGPALDSTSAMIINPDASVSFPTRTIFSSYLSANYSISAAGTNSSFYRTISCNTVTINVNGGFNVATGVFTAPSTGTYFFGFRYLDTSTTHITYVEREAIIYFYINTVGDAQQAYVPSAFDIKQGFNVFSMTAGITMYPVLFIVGKLTGTAMTIMGNATKKLTEFFGFRVD